jgi:class 3 adenylate cyclase
MSAQVLADFVMAPAVRFSQSGAAGEFRQVAPVFISFNEPNLERLNAFVSTTMQLAADYGGYFNKLDFGDKGGVILVLFGAPLAHENDLGRAADFLLVLQQAVNASPLLNPAGRPGVLRPGFQWRVGLSRGTVFAGMVGGAQRGEYTAIGTVVNLAARLMQSAPWGSIWLDEATAQRLQRTFTIDLVGTRNFKGFTEAHHVYCMKGRRVAAEDSRRGVYSGKLRGREVEFAQLQAFVQPVLKGQFGGVLVVTGEAGIGKSRLVHEFAWWLKENLPAEQAPLWVLAQTDEVLRQSLNPFRYALREYFSQSATLSEAENKLRFAARLDALAAETADPTLRQELERTRPFLGALLDLYWPGSLYDQLEPKLRFENTLVALTTLLCAESLRQPVIIFLEDLQWLDDDSRYFLLHFSRAMSADERIQYPILLLSAARELQEEEWFTISPGSISWS